MPTSDDLWFKDAIIYEAPIRSFFDANGDGKGDFRGMAQKLDYIRDLGVDCIWIPPMYPSPLRDDGYDIAHFTAIHADFGSVADFKLLVDAAHARGLKVIADLVMNHTSDQHAWFQEARSDPQSPKRDYYVWTDDPSTYSGARIIFTDTEPSNWTYDPVARQYYWHRFFDHQPDLNFDNPEVWREMFDIARFWLNLGLDGFRCDAVPYLYEREGTNCENLTETHEFLQALRRMVDKEYPGKILLAEANQWPEDVIQYFGTPENPEFHMCFHFPVMPRLYMALKREDRAPIVDILRRTPEIPANCQWATFLRNHDELTLEMVTLDERHYMWDEYAPEARMRLNLGIRRRLAPLLDNGRPEIELMNALFLSLPRSPCLYYGDEIGMGDNIWLRDRNGVRTPMQWSPDRNAGFSQASWSGLYAPVISDSNYGYQSVNVESQHRVPTSLLNWVRRIIAVRKQYKAFGRGTLDFILPDNPHVLAYVRRYEQETIVCVVNLARTVQFAELNLSEFEGKRPVDLFGETRFPEISGGPYVVSLPARGFYWFRIDP
ncbi:MAG: maltose alpha-D-glucosyltransferase / alpha-amylase [Thermomicrobiales bacterium]|nr:maltose alpha-D-glucosyltransferase / alpha-amylase [Thermomicrobiales bacterium]